MNEFKSSKAIFGFPAQLTEAEDKLLKKLKLVKEKKKAYLDAKSNREQRGAQKVSLKRASIDTLNSTDDAKETAKKLIKSGAIKLEAEAKEKGFKRSLSRKDDHFVRKTLHTPDIKSPLASNTSSASSTYSPSNTHSPSPQINQNKFQFNRQYNNFQYQTPPIHSIKMNTNSLYVRGDKDITEDFLRQVFTTNVTDLQIVSIDMKKSYAFVAVETKQSAENAIKILNEQIYDNIKLNVSFARPRQTPFHNKKPFTQHTGNDEHTDWTDTAAQPVPSYSTSNTTRNVISYEDNTDPF